MYQYMHIYVCERLCPLFDTQVRGAAFQNMVFRLSRHPDANVNDAVLSWRPLEPESRQQGFVLVSHIGGVRAGAGGVTTIRFDKAHLREAAASSGGLLQLEVRDGAPEVQPAGACALQDLLSALSRE